MASKVGGGNTHNKVFKKTSQGGGSPKTSSMNKTQKRNYKKYRGQGR
jgi:hypothetical protein